MTQLKFHNEAWNYAVSWDGVFNKAFARPLHQLAHKLGYCANHKNIQRVTDRLQVHISAHMCAQNRNLSRLHLQWAFCLTSNFTTGSAVLLLSFFSHKCSHTWENNTADLQITMCSPHVQRLLRPVKRYRERSNVCNKQHLHDKLQLRAQLNKWNRTATWKVNSSAMYNTCTTCHIQDNGTLYFDKYGDTTAWLTVVWKSTHDPFGESIVSKSRLMLWTNMMGKYRNIFDEE